ncbi:MAG TPA: HD domain-containing protein [Methylomirabilota bacterium]|nr:HD domain-containing protein [Methylomirabilota bacterium]
MRDERAMGGQPAILALEALGLARGLLAVVAEVVEGPAWLVGGAVRDALRGAPAPVEDLDIALPAGSLAAARRLADRLGAAFVPLGEPHGMARVVVRTPTPALIDLADFRGPSLEADLTGRDVTVDALAVPLDALLGGRAPVIDPTGGLGDLAARRLRACGPTAFADDPVRVLRLLRLAHALGFAVEPETERLARAAVAGLAAVAAERVRDEVTRWLRLPDTTAVLRDAEAWSVLFTLLPEAVPMRATTQSAPHRFTVWEHSVRALGALEALLADLALLVPHHSRVAAHFGESLGSGLTRREVLKLAVLLHDVAKPETRSVDPDGRVRFSGHDRLGAERAAAIAARWRWPGPAARVLERLVRQHLRPMHLGMLAEISRRARYRFFRDLGDEVSDLVCLTIADAAATDDRPPAAVYRGATRALLDSLLTGQVEAAEEAAEPPLVRGGDVMAAFGLAAGPEVGRLLARVREAQALGLVRTREEALDWLARQEGSPRG